MDRFVVPPHNLHYEGTYSEREIEWRRIGAIDKARNLRELLGNRHVSSVLEVGCGTGAVLARVTSLGIGTSHAGVDMADPQKHLDPAALGLAISEYDGTTLPFANNSFDLVYASHVVEHVPDPRGLMAEMKRVSRQLVYMEVPCELHLRTTVRSMQRTLDIGHINAYTPESFLLLVQSTGLDVLDAKVFDHSLAVHSFNASAWRGRLKSILRGGLLRMSRRWAPRLFTFHYGVLCGQPSRTAVAE